MKKSILILLFFSLEAIAAPCGGAAGEYHLNPNGTSGGFVASTAVVSKTVTVEYDSTVCDKAKINGSAQIKGKSEILGSSEISGNPIIVDSRIYGTPKIFGNSTVIGSVICQASQINSLRVIKTNYYCNVDDPEPRDPGEAGMKSLLGIDSDGDGVRDDVEIWLNREYSNTSSKDFTTELMASKLYFKNISDSLKMRKNSSFQIQKWKERLKILECNNISKYDDIMPEYLNTKERLFAWIEITGKSHGEIYEQDKMDCNSFNSKYGITGSKHKK